MDRTDVAYVVNSTPAYFYILPFHFGMLRRYAPSLKWTVILATEVPDDPVCKEVAAKYDVEILPLDPKDAGFLDSRRAAGEALVTRFKYIFPVQEDFILERQMDGPEFASLLNRMDDDSRLVSARCMPCPGPFPDDDQCANLWSWQHLEPVMDSMGFVFQATMWKTSAFAQWYIAICGRLEELAPRETTDPKERAFIEVRGNLAENSEGQKVFWNMSYDLLWRHIGYTRCGKQPNGVYLSPFPYRPTAIVRGLLEPWAKELARREGFFLLG